MKTAAAVRKNLKFYEDLNIPVEQPCVAYVINGSPAGDEFKNIVVLINPSRKPVIFSLPEGRFAQVLDENGLSVNTGKILSGKTEVPAISLYVLKSL